jgi:predicted component of type VI protein secretion system
MRRSHATKKFLSAPSRFGYDRDAMAGLVLRVTGGNAAGTDLSVTGEMLIGRAADAPGDLRQDAALSRQHARIWESDGALLIIDLGSRNGTRVNGRQLTAEHRLAAGDTIEVGDSKLSVEGVAPPPEPQIPSADQLTRIGLPVAHEPTPEPAIPAGQATRVGGPPPTPEPAIAAGQATRIGGPPPTPEPAIPAGQATRVGGPPPIPEPAIPVGEATRIGGPPATPEPAIPAGPATRIGAPPPPLAAPPAPAGAPHRVAAPVGAFAPARRRRNLGAATRLWVPATLTFLVIGAVAAALIIYFASRGG